MISSDYPIIIKIFGISWLQASKNSDHVLWKRWNISNRLKFLERWEEALEVIDKKNLIKPKIKRMLKNADLFLDTIAQIEVASELVKKSLEIELEVNKSGKTPDIFLKAEKTCMEVKNLHMDTLLVEQAGKVIELKDRLSPAVEDKYEQLPEGYPNILVIITPPEIQFDEFEDLFIGGSTTLNLTTGKTSYGKPNGFFYQERIDKSKIYTKISAVIMWKDRIREFIINPNASEPTNQTLLDKIIRL